MIGAQQIEIRVKADTDHASGRLDALADQANGVRSTLEQLGSYPLPWTVTAAVVAASALGAISGVLFAMTLLGA